MNLSDMNRGIIEGVLNRFPEVRWDRAAGGDAGGAAYGWIDREDEHQDFLVVMWEPDADGGLLVGMVTSSAEHSRDFNSRLGAAPEDHQDCERIEHELPGVTNAIRL